MLALSVLIGFYSLNWDSYGTSIQSASCLFFAVLLIVAPAILLKITVRDFDKLGDKEMQQYYGSFYPDLELQSSSGRAVLMQPAFFYLRRLIMAVAIVVCRKTLIAQIFLIWAQSMIAHFIISLASPYKTGE